MNTTLVEKAACHLDVLCRRVGNRAVGSRGNREATEFFERTASSFGWEIETDALDVVDWDGGAAGLTFRGDSFHVQASPYSRGCSIEEAELVRVSSVHELERAELRGKAVLLHGEIAREQLMPKNFIFYNPESHRMIISLLEHKNPAVIICATGRNSALAGGAYPFPLIEDGDFDIPSVYMTDVEGARLLAHSGGMVTIRSSAARRPDKAFNVTALRRVSGAKRIVLTAHIDAKKGTPGAIDNATGVVILLLAAELLRDYTGGFQLELAAFNGEDYYAVPGQMDFIRKNEGRFGGIMLNINIDGAGYMEGDTAFSFYGTPDHVRETAEGVIREASGAVTGPEWPQGDHSIFMQYGVPAIAVSSLWLTAGMETQALTHTEADNPDIVDCEKTAAAARMIAEIVRRL
ncbi:MAG: Zn-dependent exopeptidase M28 [Spirochaetes bacterium]|nr:MAG: Zn-dependent exopeptidase M28 [Spirochaetota bacterium]